MGRDAMAREYDIIGDVHGCADELRALLSALGYGPTGPHVFNPFYQGAAWVHPEGRTAVFLGDLIDRGPDSIGVVGHVSAMVAAGAARCVMGNHEYKLLRVLDGARAADTSDHLAIEAAIVAACRALGGDENGGDVRGRAPRARAWLRGFLVERPVYLSLAGGRLIAVHAALLADMLTKAERTGVVNSAMRGMCLHGQTDGTLDMYGLPTRRDDWTGDFRSGVRLVVYGHTPGDSPLWEHDTVCIDGGCVFGGSLLALRYPERNIVRVPATRAYAHSPFIRPGVVGRVGRSA